MATICAYRCRLGGGSDMLSSQILKTSMLHSHRRLSALHGRTPSALPPTTELSHGVLQCLCLVNRQRGKLQRSFTRCSHRNEAGVVAETRTGNT